MGLISIFYEKVDFVYGRKSDMLFKDLGTDTTTAIRMFLTQAVANNGFPFEIRKNTRAEYVPYETMTEEMLAKLKRSRGHCAEGRYREADEVISDLRGKFKNV